jgi:hypothetical protein
MSAEELRLNKQLLKEISRKKKEKQASMSAGIEESVNGESLGY